MQYARHCLLMSFLFGSFSCGKGIAGEAFEGRPLFAVDVAVTGTIPPGADNPRVSLAWLVPAKHVACDEESCLGAPFYYLHAEDVPPESLTPLSFVLEVHQVPPPQARSGGIAVAMPFLYSDGNGNERLDRVAWDATEAADTILGATISSSHGLARRILVFAEPGATNKSMLPYTCPKPPVGFSIYDLTAEERCVLVTAETLELRLIDELRPLALCAAPPSDVFMQIFETQWHARPPDTAPEGLETAVCSRTGGSLTLVADPSRICPEWYTWDYDLYYPDESVASAGPWDMRDSPPAWWPCEVEVGEVQRVVSWQTSLPMACDVLIDDPYITDYVAVESDGVTLDFIQCSTATNCVGYDDVWSFNLSSMSMWNLDANACQVTLSEPTQTTDAMGNNVYDVSLLTAYAPVDEAECRLASFNDWVSEASCFMRYVLVAEPL